MNSTNNVAARQAYQQAQNMFYVALRDKFPEGAAGDMACRNWVNNLKLAQSEIRCEVKLNTANNIFTFGVTQNQPNTNNQVFNTEQRLNMQDSLCVAEYGIFVGKPTSDTDTAWTPLTYGNPNIFTTANAAAAINGTFYGNGNFALKCNNDVLIPGRGLFNHYYVPQTQQSGVTASATVPLYRDQQRGAEDGFITAEPNLVLVGTKNYIPQIVLPAALAAVETFERAVIIFRGVLAQNSTVVS